MTDSIANLQLGPAPRGLSGAEDTGADAGPGGRSLDLSFLDPPTEPGDLGRIAHYRVSGLLGVGGMGVVFRAEDTHLRRTVALKVMRREFVESYTSRERFLQEARVAASLESEYIVTVYQVGMHNDVPFLAMQFLNGESLDARLERQAPLPLPDALLIARQTAAGLTEAHARGLVHRDIKPANIWLETDANSKGFRRVRLLDFGLARVLDSARKLTNMGVIIGTPQYMSPEQACGSPVDPRADLFSLGSVLYVMLTGRLPFTGPTAPALLMALVSHTPPRVAEVNRLVPPAIDDLVSRLMAKEPADRPATAQEVVDVLDMVLVEYSSPSLTRTSGTIGFPTRQPYDTNTPPPVTLIDRRGATIPSLDLTHVTPGAQTHPASGAPRSVFPLAAPLNGTPRLSSGPVSHPLRSTDPIVSLEAPAPGRTGRRLPRAAVVGLFLACAAGVGLAAAAATRSRTDAASGPTAPAAADDLRVGVLFSDRGSMAVIERSLTDATILAVDEVNQKGGVLGRKVTAVKADAGQTPEEYARSAEALLKDQGVEAIFGCAASADRRAVRPVVERANSALFYPLGSEGMEQSPRVVYVGPTAAQSTVPAVRYLLGQGCKRVFVLGTETVYSRASAAVIGDVVRQVDGAAVVGEAFFPVGEQNFAPVVAEVRAAKPDVIVNTVRRGAPVVLAQQLRAVASKITCPILHLTHLEDLDTALDPDAKAGDYVACSYLSGDAGPAEGGFGERFRAKYGEARDVTDSMAAAYTAVHLWAAAAEAAGSAAPDAVLGAVPRIEVASPFGPLRAADGGRHFPFRLLLARYQPDGQLKVVHRTEPLAPEVYPDTRKPQDWERYLRQLSLKWGGRWQGEPAK